MENLLTPRLIRQTEILLKSYFHWFKKELVPSLNSRQATIEIFEAPFVVVSHGIEADPLFNYGNRAALRLWEMSWEEFTKLSSKHSVESRGREERERLLQEVKEKGYSERYEGIRISKSGKRFHIHEAAIWNLIDEKQNYRGQAATFSKWTFL